MEAARSPSSERTSVSHLWQWPACFFGLIALSGAAYVMLRPRPAPALSERFDRITAVIQGPAPSAAIEPLNRLLIDTAGKKDEPRVHAMLAEAIDRAQLKAGTSIAANNSQVLLRARRALEMGYKPDQQWLLRVARVAEELERPKEALDFYQRAMLEGPVPVVVNRHVLELAALVLDPDTSDKLLSSFVDRDDLKPADKVWAGLRHVEGLLAGGKLVEARARLLEMEKQVVPGGASGAETAASPPGVLADSTVAGLIQCRLGDAFLRLGDPAEAERRLRLARQLLTVSSPMDGEAAALLGDVLLSKNDFAGAASFYQDVLTTHPDSPSALWARLGRGLCRLSLGQQEPGLEDFASAVRRQEENPTSRQRVDPDKLADRLASGSTVLAGGAGGTGEAGGASGENVAAVWDGAIELLTLERRVRGWGQPPGREAANLPPTFWARAASIYERYAGAIPAGPKSRKLLGTAADAYFAYSMAVTISDDKASADALWHAVDLYDRAGDTRSVARTLDRFAGERPESPQAPEALLRLGKAYQAMGELGKAVAVFQRLQLRYEQSLSASKSLVPLAQVYVLQGPEFYGRAERLLIGVLENNRQLTPQAAEFQSALFELARLYYRTDRYEESIGKLDEILKRYPADEHEGQVLFFMADGYRKSAALLALAAAGPAGKGGAVGKAGAEAAGGAPTVPVAATGNEAAEERQRVIQQRRLTAKVTFEKVIEWYRQREPVDDLERLHLKLSHFYLADCAYDLGQYEEAVRLYDRAAFRYQDDASSLAAWVQMVNALVRQGKIEQARAVNERAKQLLKRMPPEAFTAAGAGGYSLSKAYWESWLKWTGESGLR